MTEREKCQQGPKEVLVVEPDGCKPLKQLPRCFLRLGTDLGSSVIQEKYLAEPPGGISFVVYSPGMARDSMPIWRRRTLS